MDSASLGELFDLGGVNQHPPRAIPERNLQVAAFDDVPHALATEAQPGRCTACGQESPTHEITSRSHAG
jgi:hypothetical protein